MRKHLPKPNDIRIVPKFCWFPTVFLHELIWLEWVYVLQIYESIDWDHYGWVDNKEASMEEIYTFRINQRASWDCYTEFLQRSHSKT